MATFGELKGVRLGRRERELLLRAAPPGSAERPDAITGMTHVIAHGLENPRSESQSLFRAARRLHDLGLVEYAKQIRGERGVYIELTELGAAVVDRYRHELEFNDRIRWPKEEN
jgi:hypothetical protein